MARLVLRALHDTGAEPVPLVPQPWHLPNESGCLLSHLDRILDDGTDRDRWLTSRLDVIGASDAAKLAKAASVDKYLADKLASRSFTGNAYTDSGNRWEPMMLAWAGIPGNKALIHSPGEKGFAATPDGIGRSLAECKAKHMKVVFGPTLGEYRQLAWQFLCLPEFDETEFIWVELDAGGEIRPGRNGEPCSVTIRRGDKKIVDLTRQITPIATDLLARLRAAREFERELLA